MANRKKSESPQHETFPGLAPGKLDRGTSGIHPVEQMVDAGIERLARDKYRSDRDKTPHMLDTTPRASPETTPQRAIVPHAEPHALVRAVDIKRPGRLRWKGMDVSPEFKAYAERVARGEDLPPFEGRILAQPSSKFPWEPETLRKSSRRAVRNQVLLWSSAAVVAGLLAWTVAVKLTSPPSQTFGVPASTAILSNRSATAAAAPTDAVPRTASAQPSEATPAKEHSASASLGTEPAAPTPVREVAPAPVQPPAPAPRLAVAPPSAPAPPPNREAPPAPVLQEAGRTVPVDIAAPGALRDALGALLAARAAGEAAPRSSAASSETKPSTEPAAAPANGAASAGAAGKEPSGESSAKGSLLVETPSF